MDELVERADRVAGEVEFIAASKGPNGADSRDQRRRSPPRGVTIGPSTIGRNCAKILTTPDRRESFATSVRQYR